MERKDVESLFAKGKDVRSLVIGDLMLDEYLWGKVERISPEAPVQVVNVTREDMRLGGAGNVVNNLISLGCRVSICSVIGGDENGRILYNVFSGKGVDVSGIFEDPQRVTSRKTRVIGSNQQIVRIDREVKAPITPECERYISDFFEKKANDFDVVLVSDYEKGVLTPKVLSSIITIARRQGIPVVVDPKGNNFAKYRGATILTPNRKEAEIASGIPITDEATLQTAAKRLLEEADLAALLVTRSEAGMSLFIAGSDTLTIPTIAREVFDVTGAGDTVLSVMGLVLACGADFDTAARLANVAGGLVVGKVGTSTVTPSEIIDEISRSHIDSDVKIKNIDVLCGIVEAGKNRGKRIVFTNGCFDLLHAGHVKYLQKARNLGDVLVLGLNSDASIRRLKGENRPLIGEDERAHLLAALSCTDYIVIFDDDTPLRLIEILRPDILVKGADYTPDRVVGKDVVESYGGRVELIEFVEGKSTTGVIDTILARYGNN